MFKLQRIILATVFVTSGALKILVPSKHNLFAEVLGSHNFADMAAIAIAAIEIGVAAMLATRWWKTGVNFPLCQYL